MILGELAAGWSLLEKFKGLFRKPRQPPRNGGVAIRAGDHFTLINEGIVRAGSGGRRPGGNAVDTGTGAKVTIINRGAIIGGDAAE